MLQRSPAPPRDGDDQDLLRFITCGSVDDGKSTLIGRLLHDSKLIYEDQLSGLARDSARHGTTGHHPYHGNRIHPGVTRIADSGRRVSSRECWRCIKIRSRRCLGWPWPGLPTVRGAP